MKLLLSNLALFAFAVRETTAWGNLGHETVGYVAQEFLSTKALAFVKSSLGSTYNESLGVAATWADSVKYETAYKWSAPLHFVDAEDDPLDGSCSVSETRDCADGCILTAIANYTKRVAETSLSAKQRQEALKFLDHFLGDIGQPLHVEAYKVGGNDIDAKCSGESSDNLHSVWDTGILTKNIDAKYESDVTKYASTLVTRIRSGKYKSLASSWINCSSITEPVTSTRAFTLEDEIHATVNSRAIKPLACPLIWAQDANEYDCTYVFNYTSGQDLCTGSYYSGALPIIDLQLAKQGYRLAAWLNVIFDGQTNLP